MSCVKCEIPLFLGMRQGRPLSPFLEVLTRAAGHGKEADTGRAPPDSHKGGTPEEGPRTVPSPKGAGTMMLWTKCLWEK